MVLILLGLFACGPKATVPAAAAASPDARKGVSEYNRTSLLHVDVDLEEGAYSPVEQVIRENLPEVDRCFVDYAQRVPEASGRVEIEFYVRGGRVTSHSVFVNNTGDVTVGRCIGDTLIQWSFEEGIDGEVYAAFLMLDEDPAVEPAEAR